MGQTSKYGLKLFETTDKFSVTAKSDSLNHNMELIDAAINDAATGGGFVAQTEVPTDVRLLWVDTDDDTSEDSASGYTIQASAPDNTNLLWIDTSDNTSSSVAGGGYVAQDTEPEDTDVLWVDTSDDSKGNSILGSTANLPDPSKTVIDNIAELAEYNSYSGTGIKLAVFKNITILFINKNGITPAQNDKTTLAMPTDVTISGAFLKQTTLMTSSWIPSAVNVYISFNTDNSIEIRYSSTSTVTSGGVLADTFAVPTRFFTFS